MVTASSWTKHTRRIIKALLVVILLFAFLNMVTGNVQATESPRYHTVQYGDTLTSISKQYEVTQEQLMRLNHKQNTIIYVGESLLLKEEPSPGTDDLSTTEAKTLSKDGEAYAPTAATALKGTHGQPFVLDVRDADLRDVLSMLAIRMGKTVVLLDEPMRVSFNIEGTSPRVAMELLLQREGYDYLEEGNVMLVGRTEQLQSDFSSQMVLSRFNLQYMSAANMLEALSQFGVEPQSFTVDTYSRTFWAQGTPRELGRVREIVASLDRPENIDMETAAPLEGFNLQYLSAETFEEIIIQLGITVQLITLPANPQVFWAQSAPHELERLRDLIASLDRPENTGFEIKLDMVRFNLSYVPVTRMEQYLVEAGIKEEDIRTEENVQAIWVYGPPQNREIAWELISTLDRPENAELLPTIFAYSLRNISAADAEARLITMRDEMNMLPGVETITFSFPEFSQELLVVCPPHLQEQVYSTLAQLDEARQRIRRPVDSAEGPNARNRLMARRELLAQLTGISISRMYISGNLSGDNESPYHVLWVEETPDKIQQILDMQVIIDAPRS